MTGSLLERYFLLLAGQLGDAEYGVIASPDDLDEDPPAECGCCR